MTARRKAKKKATGVTCKVRETHGGEVAVAITEGHTTNYFYLTRDAALLLAMDLMVSSSGLSSAEVAKHFKK